MRIDFVGTFGC